ncbi:MAG: HIT family protein [Chitinophagales bacterium]|jgi:histidine triad (HIT) family protein|nr:HIT family protein [Chitinophagales bacterium]
MTVFTKIINGEIPCYKIAEDENYFAFLDIRPLNLGHTLVVTKREVNYIFDLEDAELQGLIVFAKKIAIAIKKSIDCERIGMTVIGLEVPHTHIHLSPINSVHDLDFRNTKEISKEKMLEIAEKIKSNLKI